MRYVAVLFDAAETLFTTRGAVGAIYGEIAREFGSTASDEEIQSAFARQFRHSGPLTVTDEKDWWKDVVRRVFSDVGMVDDFQRFFDRVYDRFRDSRGWRLFPETRDTLESLQGRGFKLAVVSNFDSRIYSVLDSLGIREFFDTVAISSETGFAKPHPGIFHAALRVLNTRPEESMMVGDSLLDDVQAARSAGIDSVLLDRSRRYADSNAFPRIASLRELLGFIDECGRRGL